MASQSVAVSGVVNEHPPKYHFCSLSQGTHHFPVIMNYFNKTIAPIYGEQTSALRKLKKREDRKCEILEEDGCPVGILVYKRALQHSCQGYPVGQSLEIKTLGVIDPEKNSGRGLGSRLVARVDQVAQEKRAEAMHVTVSDKANGATAFFRKKQFTCAKEWDGLYKEGVIERLFVRTLRVKESKRSTDKHRESHRKRASETKAYKRTRNPKRKERRFESQNEEGEARRKVQKTDRSMEVKSRRTRRINPRFYDHANDCHLLTLHAQYLDQIRSTRKTIEGRIAGGIVANYEVGDKVRFFTGRDPSNQALCEITAIETFQSFPEMLDHVGYQRCLPNIQSRQAAINAYHRIRGYEERARRRGVVAIHIKYLG